MNENNGSELSSNELPSHSTSYEKPVLPRNIVIIVWAIGDQIAQDPFPEDVQINYRQDMVTVTTPDGKIKLATYSMRVFCACRRIPIPPMEQKDAEAVHQSGGSEERQAPSGG